LEELGPKLRADEGAVWLAEMSEDHWSESCFEISTAEVDLVEEEAVASLVPIVLKMIHVNVKMRGY
jgi:hypothetical protein